LQHTGYAKVPICLGFGHLLGQHRRDGPMQPFHHPVSLRVIRGGPNFLRTQE
ncbi:unnamed protein product, partial [Lampetra planeri]